MKRNVFLNMVSLEKAKDVITKNFKTIMPKEIVNPGKAVGRILAEPVNAIFSSPNYNAAAMDGIAVKAENTFEASEAKPLEMIIGESAFYINTGQAIPKNSDAVIMIEHIQVLDNRRVIIENPAFPWQNVRKIGEDIVATELIFTRNHKITSYCLGALISAGVFEIQVRKKPKVLIIPTGSELIDWTELSPEGLNPGQVLETNSYVLEKMIEESGGIAVKNKTILDDLNLIQNKISSAYEDNFDIVLTIGGSSAGSEDYALKAAKNLGKILIHGVTIMPGKPIIVADINSKPFFGIPGYPVSAIIAFDQFIKYLIQHMLCLPEQKRKTIYSIPSKKIASKLGIEEFVRVKLGKIKKNIVAIPLARSAGIITSITEADGIVRIPEHSEGINENTETLTELLKPISTINDTILAVGSHDNSLGILADELKRKTNLNLSSSHVGSMGGLMAIKKGLCHIAGIHLLDVKTGEYNLTYIDKYVSNINTKLINLVIRSQGIIIPKGNPKNIATIKDLERRDVLFINRQKGSGTRILTDYKFAQFGVNPNNINGYRREEFTHMEVAMAVLSGSADAAIGIYAASKALNLDFIPIVTEQYDLLVNEKIFYSAKIKILFDVINSKSFKDKMITLGGYETKKTGTILK